MKIQIIRASGDPIDEGSDEKIKIVDINTLQDLYNLYDKYGRLIIDSPADWYECYDRDVKLMVTIYDYWVE